MSERQLRNNTLPAPSLMSKDDFKRVQRLCGYHTMYAPRLNGGRAVLEMEGIDTFGGGLDKALKQAGFEVKVEKTARGLHVVINRAGSSLPAPMPSTGGKE